MLKLKLPVGTSAPTTNTPTASSRGLLYGTGLTKRIGERAARDVEKLENRVSHIDTTRIATGEDLHKILDLQLPITLVSDDLIIDPDQQAAVNGLISQQFGCIIGAAGTGKTTTVKALVARIMAEVRNPHIAFCAFTGRAVQQIKRALPREFQSAADTMHGLLEYAPVEEERYNEKTGEYYISRPMRPRRTKLNPLDQNIIIVDEGGMVPIDLWNNLIAACRPNTRIYLLGDIQQLPPVHGRSVLGFAGLAWPAYELTRNHRTEEDAIIGGAWNILHGKMPEKAPGKIAMVRIADSSTEAYMQTIGIIQKMHRNGAFNPLRDALIVPQNIETLGQEHINERLSTYFNPVRMDENGEPLNPRILVTAGYVHVPFAVGDKVMVTKNDRERGLTNGMIGVIEGIAPNAQFRGERMADAAAGTVLDDDIDLTALHDAFESIAATRAQTDEKEDERERQASHIMTVRFQNVADPITFQTAGAVNTLKHAYAFTCHKAQGGEYHTVVILCHSANLRMLSREWLYTAWTRAQVNVVLLYNPRGIQKALNQQVIKGKSLAEKFERFIELSRRAAGGDDSVSVPVLPAPKQVGTIAA